MNITIKSKKKRKRQTQRKTQRKHKHIIGGAFTKKNNITLSQFKKNHIKMILLNEYFSDIKKKDIPKFKKTKVWQNAKADMYKYIQNLERNLQYELSTLDITKEIMAKHNRDTYANVIGNNYMSENNTTTEQLNNAETEVVEEEPPEVPYRNRARLPMPIIPTRNNPYVFT